MKKLLSMLLLLVSTTFYAQIYVPDDNLEQAFIDLGYDTVLDDYIGVLAAFQVTTLHISGRNISDLTGIESLAFLISLNCSNNNITNADFSSNSVLRVLDISDNNLNTLNFNNTNNNLVITFDARNNPNLQCIRVDDEIYSTNNWSNIDAQTGFSSIDCSLLTYIPDTNFEQELINQNYDSHLNKHVRTTTINSISSLDISNENISDLTGIHDFTALEELFANNNNLTVADISSNTNLEWIRLDNNSITNVTIGNLPNMRQLELFENSLNSVDLSGLPALEVCYLRANNLSTVNLSGNPLLETISLQNNNTAFTSLDFSNNPNMKEIFCSDNNLSSLHIASNTNLRVLWCSNNNLTTLDLSHTPLLASLQCENNQLTFLDVKNGGNTLMNSDFSFRTAGNPNLDCINVDNPTYATNTWITYIDATVSFDQHCYETYVPDANFENYLETHTAIGFTVEVGNASSLGNGIANDQYVTTSKISGLTSLLIFNRGIQDITGIEDFTALETLYAMDNPFTTLDMSKNVNLQDLRVSGTSISAIDVSMLPSLEILDIADTSISTVDISANPNLIFLWVSNTQITLLDLTQNTALELLHIAQTSIEELDLTDHSNLVRFNAENAGLLFLDMRNGNNVNVTEFNTLQTPNLTCINVDNAMYATANWTNVAPNNTFDELCNDTYIPDPNFEAYLEANNLGNNKANDQYVSTLKIKNVQTLDVSNQSITDLTGIEAFDALENLDCFSNNLTSIDVSNNLNLVRLSCYFNHNLAMLTLGNLPNLEELSCSFGELTSLNLSQLPALKDLICISNELTTLDVSSNLLLEELNASLNNLTTIDLSTNTALKNVAVANNKLVSFSIDNGTNTSITAFNATHNPDLTCIEVDDEMYATTNWTQIDTQTSFSNSCTIEIAPKVFLQGAMFDPNVGESELMRDDLRVAGVIPTTSPYQDRISCDPMIFNTTGENAIVDWVWIELRSADDHTKVLASQSGLLQRNGNIVASDGGFITFATGPKNYHFSIQHRNHLGIVTGNSLVANTGALLIVSFTDASDQNVYGTNAQTTFSMPSDVSAMWAGNANNDHVVQYSGTLPDTPTILATILNDAGNFLNFPTYTVSGYNDNDINMDGSVQYSGTNPDTPFILQNVLAHPSNFLNFSTFQILEQLPQN
ncbi:MAG: hypothetical protein AAF611_16175 [Bacteroidota bacterium]